MSGLANGRIRQRCPDFSEDALTTHVEDIALAHGCHFGLDLEGWYLEGRREGVRDCLDQLNEERLLVVYGTPRRVSRV